MTGRFMLFERTVLRHFVAVYAVAGGLAEWMLVCWLLMLAGIRLPLALHLLGPIALVLLVRAGTCIFRRDEREPVRASTRAWRRVTAVAFAAMAGAAALAVTTGLGLLVQLLATQAEAGGLSTPAVATSFGMGLRVLGTGAALAAVAAVTRGYQRGYRQLRVRRFTVGAPGLAPGAAVRIVHLSDLHVGPLAKRAALREAIDAAVALDPDLICVTGDIVDNPYTDLPGWLPELARLRARAGVFAILGNHDRVAGADRVAAALAGFAGWTILRDATTVVTIGDTRIALVGIEDRLRDEHAVGLEALVAQVPPGVPPVLLIHHPAAFPRAVAARVPLTLAGHTHAGQVAIPGFPAINPARLFTRYDAGTFVEGGSVLAVNAGLGTSGQPVRIGVPREIGLVTLMGRSAAAA